MRIRPWAGLAASTITVPLAISVGALVLSLVPVLRDGVQPFTFFMLAADGLAGLFFFVYLFGAPAAFVITSVAYLLIYPWLRREPPVSGWRVVAVGAVLGALALSPIWASGGVPHLMVRYLGPAVLGALSGAAGAGSFLWLGVRPSPTHSPAA